MIVGQNLSESPIPRDPITLSEDDWGVQSPPQQSIRVPLPFSEGDWIPWELIVHLFFHPFHDRSSYIRVTFMTFFGDTSKFLLLRSTKNQPTHPAERLEVDQYLIPGGKICGDASFTRVIVITHLGGGSNNANL